MPKQKRWLVKQKLNTVIGELVRVETKIVEVGVLYKDLHPEIYDKFSTIFAAIASLQGTIIFLRDLI